MNSRIAVTCAVACVLLAFGARPTSAQSAKKTVEISESPAIHGFSVTLVLGDMQGAFTPDLPLGAKKALSDMRDFLPYKSYRLLDTQFIRCCGATKSVTPLVSGRLRGVDEQQYGFVVEYGFSGSKLSIRFTLREEPSSKKTSSKTSDVSALLEQFETKSKELQERRKQGFTAAHPSVTDLEMKLKQLREEIDVEQSRAASVPAKAAVIDSTFSMDVGETVVIGTSSLKGDKALIALLTAVRRPAAASSMSGEKR